MTPPRRDRKFAKGPDIVPPARSPERDRASAPAEQASPEPERTQPSTEPERDRSTTDDGTRSGPQDAAGMTVTPAESTAADGVTPAEQPPPEGD